MVGSELILSGLACLQVGEDSLGLVEGAADPGASACAGQLAPRSRQLLGQIGWAGGKEVLQPAPLELKLSRRAPLGEVLDT